MDSLEAFHILEIDLNDAVLSRIFANRIEDIPVHRVGRDPLAVTMRPFRTKRAAKLLIGVYSTGRSPLLELYPKYGRSRAIPCKLNRHPGKSLRHAKEPDPFVLWKSRPHVLLDVFSDILSDSFCVERHRDSFLDLIKGSIDIVFANESEIKSLYKTQNFDGAIQAIRKDCPMAVLTRSERGSMVVRGAETIEVKAYPVSQVVDVTGAGDLYAAGFLFGHTRGMPLAKCASIGSLAAAEIISHTGARPEVNLAEHARKMGLV